MTIVDGQIHISARATAEKPYTGDVHLNHRPEATYAEGILK